MGEFLRQIIDGGGILFLAPALLGTLFMVLRLLLLLIGIGDHDVGGDVGDIGHAGEHADAADGFFKFFSVQAITAFMAGFGWGGLAAHQTFELGMPVSILIGVGTGLMLGFVTLALMRMVMNFQASGNISINETIGAEGDVYVQVPAKGGGRGQVTLVIRGQQRTFNALSDDAHIASRTRIRVMRVNPDNTVTVAPI